MSEVERVTAGLRYLFSNADFLLTTQINERPGKLRRIFNNLKRAFYSRRTHERRAQNLVLTHQPFDRLLKSTRVELSVNTNHAERAEGVALNSLLYRPETPLLGRKPKTFYW